MLFVIIEPENGLS